MRNPVRDIPHYLRVFQTYLGGRMYLIFALTLTAALAEGVGILMLLPLLSSLDANAGAPAIQVTEPASATAIQATEPAAAIQASAPAGNIAANANANADANANANASQASGPAGNIADSASQAGTTQFAATGTPAADLAPAIGDTPAATITPPTGVSAWLQELLAGLGLQDSTVAVLLIITAAFIAKGLLVFGAQGYNAYLRGQLLRELKGRLFDHYSRMRYGYYASRDTGHFINVINVQVNEMLMAFQALVQVGAQLVQTLTYAALAFVVAWRFGLMALVLGVGLLALFRWLNLYVRQLSRKTAAENGQLAKQLIQTLHAFKYLSATGQVAPLRRNVTQSIARLTSYQIRTGIAAAFTKAVREPIAVVFIMAIVMVQLLFMQQPLAPILVSILLFYRGLNTTLGIQGSWQVVLNSAGSIEMVHDEFNRQRQHQEPDGPRVLGPLSQGIRLQDVHYRFDPQLGDVLKGISLSIPVRTSVALVGESGAGKSTLVDLLTLMLKPQQGQLLIDGVPGETIQLASWRRQIGYVAQETVVFDDTVANNICLWAGDSQ